MQMCVSNSRPPGKTRVILRRTSETPKQGKYHNDQEKRATLKPQSRQYWWNKNTWGAPVLTRVSHSFVYFIVLKFTHCVFFWFSAVTAVCVSVVERHRQFCNASNGTSHRGVPQVWKMEILNSRQKFICSHSSQQLSSMSSKGSTVKDVYLPAITVALSQRKFLLCLDSSLDFPLSFKGFMMQWFNKSLSFSSMHELTAWLNYGFHPCVEELTKQNDWKELVKAHEMSKFALTFNVALTKPITQSSSSQQRFLVFGVCTGAEVFCRPTVLLSIMSEKSHVLVFSEHGRKFSWDWQIANRFDYKNQWCIDLLVLTCNCCYFFYKIIRRHQT